jgi:hypothetical protein
MCVIFPTGYIFATSRYAILEDVGCSFAFQYSKLWLAIAFVPYLLVTAAAIVFAGKIHCNSNRITPIFSRYGGAKPCPLSKVHSISRLSLYNHEIPFRSHARDFRYYRCLAVICHIAGVFRFESHWEAYKLAWVGKHSHIFPGHSSGSIRMPTFRIAPFFRHLYVGGDRFCIYHFRNSVVHRGGARRSRHGSKLYRGQDFLPPMLSAQDLFEPHPIPIESVFVC